MTDIRAIKKVVDDVLAREEEQSEMFTVSVSVSPEADIVVTVDTLDPAGLDIDRCVALSQAISTALYAELGDDADFSLEVGSAGLTAPFTVPGQYVKNIGREVELIDGDRRKVTGTLAGAEVLPDGTVDFDVTTVEKQRPEGAKRPVAVEVTRRYNSASIHQINAVIRM